MEDRKLRVAITHGDTNGIGYELIFKTFAEPEMLELCTPIVYGSPKVAAYHSKALNLPGTFSIISSADEAKDGRVNLLTCFDDEVKVEFGAPSEESGTAAFRALDQALTDYKNGAFDVLVTTPVDAASIKIEGFAYKGLAHYLDTCLDNEKQAMTIYANESMRVAMVTTDIDLKNVSQAITKECIMAKATTFINTLRRDFRISNPRVAVLALNPTANGTEEREMIQPAVEELLDSRLSVFGPYAADDFFGTGKYESFDGILAMYHDQGMVPFKAFDPEMGVSTVAGLPIVSAAPLCTPRFDIAGKGEADECPLRQAIYLAIDIYRNRQNYDEPLQNPLQKIYHERREEGEKVRFAVNRRRETPREQPE